MDFGSLAGAFGAGLTGLAQGAEAGISLSQKQQTIDLQAQRNKVQALEMLNNLDKWSPALRKTAGPSALKYLFKQIGVDDMASVQPMIDIYTKDDGGEQKSAMLSFIAKTLNESPADIGAIFKNMNPADMAKVGAQMSTMKRGADLDAFRRSGYTSTDLVYDEFGRVVGRRTSKGIISVPGAAAPSTATPATPSTGTAAPEVAATPKSMLAAPNTPVGPLPAQTDDQKAADVAGLLDTANRGPQLRPPGAAGPLPVPTTIPLETDKGSQTAEAPPPTAAPVQYTKPDPNSITTPKVLQDQPVGIQSVIKGQGEYRIKPPDPNTPQGRAAMAQILKAYPDYDPSKFAARNAFITGMGRGSVDGRTLDSFRTITGHLQTLAQVSDALKSNNVRAINSIANAYGVQTGSDAVTNFRLVGRAVASEIMSALRRTGQPSERETAVWDKILAQPNFSQQQLEGAMKYTWEIVGQRFAGMAPRFNEAYQGDFPFFPKGSQTEAAKNYLDKRFGLKTDPNAPASEVTQPGTPPPKTETPPPLPRGISVKRSGTTSSGQRVFEGSDGHLYDATGKMLR